ncbi:hypothetical protein TrVE_jg417 [Triparma verrucosa]|uniref:FAD-binding FR-type domain-containing protein n=1 Tax=Triparma verrucosa TaxID=1606542 RepID=A0A9W7CG48_9STRA|nr:hypothetical protein TrVE_jg417 [Triparma verrucosa]
MTTRGLTKEAVTGVKPGHMSLAKDKVVVVLESHPSGFYFVRRDNETGWIQKSKVTIGKSFLPSANYTAGSEDELSLTSGTRVYGFVKEEEWWYGVTQNGIKGYFPSTFVTEEPASKIPNSPTGSSPDGEQQQQGAQRMPPPLPSEPPPAPPKRFSKNEGNGAQTHGQTGGGGGMYGQNMAKGASSNPLVGGKPKDVAILVAQKKDQGGGRQAEPAPGRPMKGTHPLQFLLWANNMALASAFWLFIFGIFTCMWSNAKWWGCEVEGKRINAIYLTDEPTVNSTVVCNPEGEAPELNGDVGVGVFAIFVALAIAVFEEPNYAWGSYYPSDSFSYNHKISLRGIVYVLLSLPFFTKFPVALAASFLLPTGAVCIYGASRGEAGDGGRAMRKKRAAAAKARAGGCGKKGGDGEDEVGYNPFKFYRKLVDENKLSSYVWVFLYFFSNALTFFVTLAKWDGNVKAAEEALMAGTLDTTCGDETCELNKIYVQNGVISRWGPYAKACGMCLNFNCSLIIYPVVRLLLRRLNNVGVSFSNQQANPTIFAKFFASPITRLIPLSKNIDFHKLIAKTMCLFASGHTIFHFFNYWYRSTATLATFAKWGWGGTAFFTGSVICFAMFFIFTAASDTVRYAHYEIFFSAHHWFVVYFIFLLLHGPIYWKWAAVPLCLYLWERVMQETRGDRPYYVNKVEWIEPVMAIQFRPVYKHDFVFKEGQYLYLSCPYINKNEWHPFTISSASGDLSTGPRIALETGEEVIEVPRPKGMSRDEKWAKYCPVGKDYTKMRPSQFLDKHETGYNDYVSVHIKVHGLEHKEAQTWTRKLKEYFELMNPKDSFPFYLTHRDERGDMIVGRRLGPDGQQILRVDGPHSAPSEHYTNYGTVMIIGAGIGLTPCASILTSMLRYKWKKNFNPEILHFYWMVRQSDVDSFQWLIHLITDLEHGLKYDREQKQIGPQYYCEINIYITGAKKEPVPVKELRQKENTFTGALTKPNFKAKQLQEMMTNPPASSKEQVALQNGSNSRNAPNRLQDVWVWNGRPDWDKIFAQNKRQRQHSEVGVCFCGAAVIGKDLQKNCQKHSSVEEDILFNLHKENF